MGGTSVPTLSVRVAAIRPKSVGTEVPPTRAEAWLAALWEGLRGGALGAGRGDPAEQHRD
ncbi:DUF6053 domain-containing protein [Lysobacter enzymogenes]|uniref:DUF6053 domain-containing protein n=1 Tax=Lysobacter enzymogenes TaxID=69 RepID=UPI003D2F6155